MIDEVFAVQIPQRPSTYDPLQQPYLTLLSPLHWEFHFVKPEK